MLKAIFPGFSAILFAVTLSAQVEVVSPLLMRGGENTVAVQKNGQGETIHGQFFYQLDTVSLPVFDDFSTNKFQPYEAEATDPNVTEELYYKMLDLSDLPLPMNTTFTDYPTYKVNINSGAGTQDTIWYTAEDFKYNALDAYPVDVYGTYSGYPPYIIFDTIDVAGDPDTVWVETNLYVQDTARVYIVSVTDPDYIWTDYQAYWNMSRPVDPWSLGVATFDGLDENGFPYAINTAYSDYADHLTSKVIDLNYPPNDSIYFSFLYQAGGFGDMPEEGDSLILQFFNVDDQVWENVWGTHGIPLSDFKLVHFPVVQSKFLQNGFRFRFRNYGGLSGDLDNWHVDYVNLRRLSGYQDTLVSDFAIVYPVNTLLKEYTAVPWKHFRNNPSGRMSDDLRLVVRNGSNLPENNPPGNLRVYYEEVLEHTYTFPGQTLSNGDLNYEPRTTYYSYHDLGTTYEFSTGMANDTMVAFDHEFTATAPFAQLTNANDTTRGQQVFANYYAYDDGSAELAYGINGEQARLAVQFTSWEPDSLVAVQMHFVPTVLDHSDKIFLLTVWDDNNGRPGNVLYQDDFFFPSMPEYMHDRNLFWNYYFRDNIRIPVSGVFYVGWRQIEQDALNVGLDKNTNSQQKVFYSINGEISWLNSSYSGSLMIRPVVSSKMNYQLSTDELMKEESTEDLVVYPNPFNNVINLSEPGEGTVELFTLDGRKVLESEWQTEIRTDTVQTGMYMLVIRDKKGVVVNTHKITKL